MNYVDMLMLFVIMLVLALAPSSSVALVVARSSTAGFLNGAVVAFGILVGDLVFVYLAILGMAVLAETMGSFFLILRYMAGAYLIWLGISLLRSNTRIQVSAGRSASTLSASFFSGLIITLGDVKAIFFYASLFPAFVDLTTIATSDIATIIVLTVVAVGGVKLGYVYFASRILSWTKSRVHGVVKKTAGGFMVGAGTYLMVKA
ncbi:LysE family translocator [Nitrincola sp.]|uniref:LysE family translocator n=1 Tax=Nitrincola sp. TaxID=1926584 RepID=UPI003A9316E9